MMLHMFVVCISTHAELLLIEEYPRCRFGSQSFRPYVDSRSMTFREYVVSPQVISPLNLKTHMNAYVHGRCTHK